jgi:hypothetical protein
VASAVTAPAACSGAGADARRERPLMAAPAAPTRRS